MATPQSRITIKPSFLGIAPFYLTVFLGAFLIFQVQPLISRYILPWFGGTPAVWSTSMLFFQTLLLFGYAFAHWLTSKNRLKLWFFLCLLLLSAVVLVILTSRWGSPILPGSKWKPLDADQPISRILRILTVSVGLPYFLLSMTSPLIQSWYKLLNPQRSPYHLYAFSNFGSFLGLISYPFIFELLFLLQEQSWIWFALYLIFIGLCSYLGLKVLAYQPGITEDTLAENPVGTYIRNGISEPSVFQKFLWVALSACTSILLLSVTNQLTQEVAVIPFLWVLPLSLYLFSFIVTFSGEKWYPRLLSISLLMIATVGIGVTLISSTTIGLFFQILIFSFFLLLATLVCHGELYRVRPDAKYLTSFYLYIAFGGVIGGIFVNLIAPQIFNGYWELHLGIILCWVLILVLQFSNRPSLIDRKWVRKTSLIFSAVICVSGYLLYKHYDNTLNGVLDMKRNFYGVYRVRSIGIGNPTEIAYGLNHGTTSHGFQFQEEESRTIPTSYYGFKSGVGLALKNYRDNLKINDRPIEIRVGVIGLGAGTLAAYGQDGDHFYYYEINPDIIELALGEGNFFTYLTDSKANTVIQLGDARLSLESELEYQGSLDFDILVLDAFSSDAIPIHLLTAEAFNVYLQHLNPDGVLAVHISNRYLNLSPVVQKLAANFQLNYALIRNPRDESLGSYTASWMLLSKNKDFFLIPEIAESTVSLSEDETKVRLWTDNYSNLIPLIKMDIFTRIR